MQIANSELSITEDDEDDFVSTSEQRVRDWVLANMEKRERERK